MIANKVPQAKVTVVDVDRERIDAWNSTELPIYEPGLYDLVSIARDGIPGQRASNLFFSTAVDDAIREADLIFVSVNTPTKISGLGAGRASDLGRLEMAIRRIARCAEHNTIVVQKSTVPCGTAKDMQKILRANARPGVGFEVLSNPEFLAEGTAISNLLFPDRILIGSFETHTGINAAERLTNIYASWVPRDKIITVNIWSAELSKLASNALLAQRISSINALSSICEAIGADIEEVSLACGLDNRIGPKMLNASVGFGGSCFKKDIMNLSHISASLNLPEVADYWESVVEVNEYQKSRFIQKMVNTMHCTLSKKRVAVFGFAYKKNTRDTRESAAISVVKNLLSENAVVAVFDPQVRHDQIYKDLNVCGPSKNLQVCLSPYHACNGAHAVLILTEWDIFSNKLSRARSSPYRLVEKSWQHESVHSNTVETRDAVQSNGIDSSYDTRYDNSIEASHPRRDCDTDRFRSTNFRINHETAPSVEMQSERLDWSRVASLMQRPMHVFDGRNTVDAYKLRSLGFHVVTIGSSFPEILAQLGVSD